MLFLTHKCRFLFCKGGNEAREPWLRRGGAAGPARLDAAVSLVQPPKPGRDPNQGARAGARRKIISQSW